RCIATLRSPLLFILLSFHSPAPAEISTLSLHDALPISVRRKVVGRGCIYGQREGDFEPVRHRFYRLHLKRNLSVPLQALQPFVRSEEHTSELQSRENLVCRLLLEKKKIASYGQSRPLRT